MNGSVTARQKSTAGEALRTLPDSHRRLLLLAYLWKYIDVDVLQRVFPELPERTAQDRLQALRERQLLKAAPRVDPRQRLLYAVTRQGRRLLRAHYDDPPILDTP